MPNPEACASNKLPAGGAVGPHWPKGLPVPFTCPHWMKPLWESDTPTCLVTLHSRRAEASCWGPESVMGTAGTDGPWWTAGPGGWAAPGLQLPVSGGAPAALASAGGRAVASGPSPIPQAVPAVRSSNMPCSGRGPGAPCGGALFPLSSRLSPQ